MNNNKVKTSCKQGVTKDVILNLFQDIHLLKSASKEEMLKRVPHDNRRGFTLIELLVVVLIIGILAAVAIPQYQKTVQKARMTEFVVSLYSIGRALKLYRLENGTFPDKSLESLFDPSKLSSALGIDIPPLPKDTASFRWSLYYRPENNYVGYYNVKDPLWFALMLDTFDIKCSIPSNSVTGQKVALCQSLCKNPPNYSGSGAYVCFM